MNQALTTALESTTKYLSCLWVFVNPAQVDAWRASPEAADPRYHAISGMPAFRRACQRAHVADATFHDLQHSFVTPYEVGGRG